jgi:hypothetical protein
MDSSAPKRYWKSSGLRHRAITDAGADVALITSFNERPEIKIVEPSSTWSDPYFYLKILAEWQGVAFTAPPLPQPAK